MGFAPCQGKSKGLPAHGPRKAHVGTQQEGTYEPEGELCLESDHVGTLISDLQAPEPRDS